MNSIKIGTLNPDGTVTEKKPLMIGHVADCPHFIFDPSHYREDGSCKCNDKSNTIMKKWGYKWNAKAGLWS